MINYWKSNFSPVFSSIKQSVSSTWSCFPSAPQIILLWLYHLCMGRPCHLSVFAVPFYLEVPLPLSEEQSPRHESFRARLLSVFLTDVYLGPQGRLRCLVPWALLIDPQAFTEPLLCIRPSCECSGCLRVENEHSPYPLGVSHLTENTVINSSDRGDTCHWGSIASRQVWWGRHQTSRHQEDCWETCLCWRMGKRRCQGTKRDTSGRRNILS